MKHLFVFLILNIDWSIQRKSNDCLTASTGGEGDTSKPFYIDPTFIKINWTDLNDGWDEAARLDYLDLVRKLKYQRKIMPKFTKLGYIKMEIPQRVLDVILKEKFKHSVPEGCDPIIGTSWSINCRKIDDQGRIMLKNNIHLFHFGSDLIVKKALTYHLKSILSSWANVTLGEHMIIYGIRRYTRGARLWSHVDKLPTHTISAILQVSVVMSTPRPRFLREVGTSGCS